MMMYSMRLLARNKATTRSKHTRVYGYSSQQMQNKTEKAKRTSVSLGQGYGGPSTPRGDMNVTLSGQQYAFIKSADSPSSLSIEQQ
jgi:hypothetical protein